MFSALKNKTNQIIKKIFFKEFSQEINLKNISQNLDEINSSDIVKMIDDDFKCDDVTKISKVPESLPAYQVCVKLL